MKKAYLINKRVNMWGLKTPLKVEILSEDGGMFEVRTIPTEYAPYSDDRKGINVFGTECFLFSNVCESDLLMVVK